MPVTPTDYLSLTVSQLRLTLADSTTWRTWVGAANQGQALGRIYRGKADASDTLPLAVIEGPSTRWERDGGGARERWLGTAYLRLTIRAGIAQADDFDASADFTNKLGAIEKEMRALMGRVGYVDADGLELVPPGPVRPRRPERVTGGDYYEASYRVIVALVEQ